MTLSVPRAAVDTEIKAKGGGDAEEGGGGAEAAKTAQCAAGLAAALGVELAGLVVSGIVPDGEASKTQTPTPPGVPPATVQKKWILAEVNGRGWPEGSDAQFQAGAGDAAEQVAQWLRAAIDLDGKRTRVAFRSSLGGDTRPVIGLGLESKAQKVALRGLIIRGGVRVRDGVLRVGGCDFAGATDEEPNLLSIDPYAAPEVRRCRFRGAKKACVYCYPHSKGSVEDCDIIGENGSGCGIFMDNGATT